MSLRIDGNLVISDVTNNLGTDFDNIKAYISSPDTKTLGNNHYQKGILDKCSVYNLRFINVRQRHVVKIGSQEFVARLGPSTLAEAQAYCKKEGKMLYKPAYQAIHKIVYNKLSKYGVTTMWVQARYNFASKDNTTTGQMVWM